MSSDNRQGAPIVPAGGHGIVRGHQPALPTEVWEEPERWESPLAELLRIVLRRRRLVLACLLLVFGLTACRTFTAPRVYEAVATFLVSESEGGTAERAIEDQLPSTAEAIAAPWLETHASLMKGTATAEATADWLAAHGGPKLTASEIRGAISTSIVPKTQLVQLRARADSPQHAERLANATAEAYVGMNRGLAQSASTSASHYLKEQLDLAGATLHAAERKLQGFKESTGTVADDAEAAKLLERAAAMRGDIDEANADLAQAQERLENVRAQLAQQNRRISVSQVRDNTIVQQLRARLVELEGQRLAAASRYTREMPGPAKALEKQIGVVKAQLESEIRTVVSTGGGDLAMQQALTAQLSQGEIDVASLTARVQELQSGLAEADRQLARVPARQITLARLQREVEVAQGIHADLLRRSQEIEVGRVMALGNATLVEPAVAPRAPISPRTTTNLLLGLVLGLGLGIGLALALEQFDDAVGEEEEVLRVAEAPVMSMVPVLPAADIAAMIERSRRPRRALEAYVGLRYSLGYVVPSEGGRTVLVTSPSPGEGKTTTAVNLAIAAALAGRRAVLVDADMRQPSVSRLLSLNGAKGLSDYLSGQASLEQIVQDYGDLELKVIPSGGHAPNPTNLLDSERMQHLVQALRREADLVIFDSVPMLSAADGLILAGFSDATLLVCVPGSTRRYALRRTRALLANVGRAITGVVMNKVPRRPGYGYYRGHYYYSDRRHETASVGGDRSGGEGGGAAPV